MAHLVHDDARLPGAAAEQIGLHHDAVLWIAVRGWEVGIARHAALDFPHQPDVDVVQRIPAVEVFHGDVVGAHVHAGQWALVAGDARGGIAVGVALGEAELDVGVHASVGVIVADVCKSIVQVLDALQNLGVGDVLRPIVMDDVDNDGQGVQRNDRGVVATLQKLPDLLVECVVLELDLRLFLPQFFVDGMLGAKVGLANHLATAKKETCQEESGEQAHGQKFLPKKCAAKQLPGRANVKTPSGRLVVQAAKIRAKGHAGQFYSRPERRSVVN